MHQTSPLIEELADLVGFHESYIDSFGSLKAPNPKALESLLVAMGYNLTNNKDIAQIGRAHV